jgi:hypothetical protein
VVRLLRLIGNPWDHILIAQALEGGLILRPAKDPVRSKKSYELQLTDSMSVAMIDTFFVSDD